jgi:hypothetical protein
LLPCSGASVGRKNQTSPAPCLRADKPEALSVAQIRAREAIGLQLGFQGSGDPGVDLPLDVMAPLVAENRPPENLGCRVVRRPRRRVVDRLVGRAVGAGTVVGVDVAATGGHRAVDRDQRRGRVGKPRVGELLRPKRVDI